MASPDSPAADPGTTTSSGAEPLVCLDQAYLDRDLFTPHEIRVVAHLKRFAAEDAGEQSQELQDAMDQGFGGLAALVHALRSYPSLRERGTLGRRERSGETLMRKLLEAGQHAVEWSLPTKAIISRTFGIAKVNFWTAMRYAVTACNEDEAQSLSDDIQACIEEAVYTRLAEEVYGSFVTSRTTDPAVRREAIEALVDLWEGRVRFATDRFCPILRSAWAARCRAPRTFGTLLGASELFHLLFADCSERFVEAIASSADEDETHAFEEFLFDLPFESLERVRLRMREDGRDVVDASQVADYLGLGTDGLRPLVDDPKALYTSFRTRRVKAQYRTSMGVPGPKRTAEAYVLEALLRDELAAKEKPDGN